MELHIEAKGDKKPSTTMSLEIVRLCAFAAPGSPLAQHRSSISTAESGLISPVEKADRDGHLGRAGDDLL